jgi:adenine deaminase
MICIERHGRTGGMGKCFLQGLGLKRGAIAESVSHDCHNIIAAGTSARDIAAVANEVIRLEGGIALARDGKILGSLALPVGGLITDELSGEELHEKLSVLAKTAAGELGCSLHEPFMHLSFLSLSTSPKWKLTDRGLLDVDAMEFLDPLLPG